MDKTKNPAVVGAGPYDGNGAVLTSCMNATTIVIKRASLGVEQQQSFVTNLSAKVSRKTVLNIIGTLSSMLNTAKN